MDLIERQAVALEVLKRYDPNHEGMSPNQVDAVAPEIVGEFFEEGRLSVTGLNKVRQFFNRPLKTPTIPGGLASTLRWLWLNGQLRTLPNHLSDHVLGFDFVLPAEATSELSSSE